MYEQQFPFGKNKDKPLAVVETSYLRWALRECKLSSGLRAAVAAELEVRGVSAPPPPAPKPELPCHRCGLRAFRYRWMEDRRGRRQVRRECSSCGSWLGFAPAVPPYTTEADAAASATPVLDALLLAEAEGVQIVSDGEQVRFGGDGWRKASERLKAVMRQQGHQLAKLLGRGACA